MNQLHLLIEKLSKEKSINFLAYIFTLIKPEIKYPFKIPYLSYTPTCTFQYRYTRKVPTNDKGLFQLIFTPGFLYSDDIIQEYVYQIAGATRKTYMTYATSLYANNYDLADGKGTGEWRPYNCQVNMPNYYTHYRLVSSSMTIKYIGAMETTSGYLASGIIYDTINPYMLCTAGSNQKYYDRTTLEKYMNFGLLNNLKHHKITNTINNMRCIYYPIDNKEYEFKTFITSLSQMNDKDLLEYNTNQPKENIERHYNFNNLSYNRFHMTIYGEGLPKSEECLRLELICNYECIVNPQFNDLIFSNTSNIELDNKQLNDCITTVQKYIDEGYSS